jgi:hypothetical protein
MSLYVEIDKTARERARAALEKAAAKLRADEENRQLNVTTEIIFGSPKGVILEEARHNWEAKCTIVDGEGFIYSGGTNPRKVRVVTNTSSNEHSRPPRGTGALYNPRRARSLLERRSLTGESMLPRYRTRVELWRVASL